MKAAAKESGVLIHDILKRYWGFNSFRPLQEDIIRCVLEGKDCLAILPTGGGKSLCYQVPAMAGDGLCLVISPLIALMKDQVENLRKKNITAFAIYSGMSRKEVINNLRTASESNCRFLYVSPERLETETFLEYLPGLRINLVAVDEAHCISQWGYDFRPSYLRLASLKAELPAVPFLALTASATPAVQKDICEKLGFDPPRIFRQSFARPNLSYSVFKVPSKINKILEVLNKVTGSSIIYCRTRKRSREICELLQLQHISADYYHAGLDQTQRSARQDAWLHNQKRVIVCTNAFGMGIDKPDVRTVIHADLPDSLESYYQEAGRAGRDGKTAFTVLLYDERDLRDLETMLGSRFPSLAYLRKVYQCVANYLQIPEGSGREQYFDFDLPDFLKKFKLESYSTLYALKSLEQDDWLSFNEQVFLPSQVSFTVNKDALYEFERSNPSLEPIIKTLLRSYEGIFDRPVTVSEKLIAGLMKSDGEKVKMQLAELHRYGVIEYRPQKDNPQLFLRRPRVRAEDLTIDPVAREKRKNSATERMRAMQEYATEQGTCRSRLIAAYFGDDSVGACGICDNCLRQKNISLSREEFESLRHRIINIIKYEALSPAELLAKLNGHNKEKAWKVIDFLQAEDLIEMDGLGKIRLK